MMGKDENYSLTDDLCKDTHTQKDNNIIFHHVIPEFTKFS